MCAVGALPELNSIPAIEIIGLMGTACCMGAIKANVAALGADQFDVDDAKEAEQKGGE